MPSNDQPAARVQVIGPVNEPGFKGWKVIADGLHVATHQRKREAEDDARSWEAMLDE
jgi:hypothetical protein